jgi:hypothetical protein
MSITDPSAPAIIGHCQTPGYANSSVIIGEIAYVTDGDLQIIDVSNPKSPKIIGSVKTPGTATDVEISGDKAYVADSDEGIQVIDITDLKNPKNIGYAKTGYTTEVTIIADTIYLNGGEVVDINKTLISNITIGSVKMPGYALAIEVVKDIAYIGF